MTVTPSRPKRQRADARQNIDRIVEAAIGCLGHDPDASMAEIARCAEVGRVTLYAHFSSREVLIEAAMTRLLERGEEALAALDLGGDPMAALVALVESSWLLTAQAGSVLQAAQAVLPPGRVHALHSRQEDRTISLLRRGQSEGVFWDNVSADWLASALFYLMKGTAADVAAGRLDQGEVPALLVSTARAIVSGPP